MTPDHQELRRLMAKADAAQEALNDVDCPERIGNLIDAEEEFIDYARQAIPQLLDQSEAFEDREHALTIKIESLEREVKRLSKHDRWRAIAQGLTPGGSEYCDPDYTEKFLKEQREANHEASKTSELRRRQIESDKATIERLMAALENVHGWLVCAPLATADDMAQSFDAMELIARSALNGEG